MSESDLVLLPERFEFVSAVGANRDEMLDPRWNAPWCAGQEFTPHTVRTR